MGCAIFQEYQLNVETIHPANLRSEKLVPVGSEEYCESIAHINSVLAIIFNIFFGDSNDKLSIEI